MKMDIAHKQDATRPPAPYIGGKRRLARQICDMIETTPHRTYAEVFVGMLTGKREL